MTVSKSKPDKPAAAAPAEEGFKLSLDKNQIILVVPQREKDEPGVTADEVLSACQKRGYYEADRQVVERIVAAANGVPSIIGIHEPRKATASITVAADNMQAWIRLSPPEPGGGSLGLDELKALIRAENIIYGVKEDVLARIASSPEYEEDILVAEGRPVENGVDADFLYHFETEKHVRPLVADESGKIDHKELNLIENVVEGQHLVTKIAPTPGTPGITVKNEYIAPKPGKDRALAVGKNVTISENGLEGYAAANGAAMLLAGKVTVSQVYQVKGSVGPSTGNVNFLGSVFVSDSIEDGFSVKATDAVSVGKTVGKAVVEAGGDITVRGGVIEAKITSGGDVRAKFIEASEVDARNDVIVSEAVMHSHIDSGGQVIVGLGGRKGTVVGGQIRAHKLLACKVLGSPMSTKTNVDTGINPKLLARMEELQTGIVKDRANFENLRKGLLALNALKEKLGNLPDDKKRIYDTLVVAQESMKTKLQEMATELRDLQTQASVKVKAVVSVSDEVYPGVKISIGSSVFYTTQEEKYVTFKEEGGEIRIHTYEAPKLKKDKKKGAADDGEEMA